MKLYFVNSTVFIATTSILFFISSSTAIPTSISNQSLGLNLGTALNNSSVSNNTAAPHPSFASNKTAAQNSTTAPNPTPASNNTLAPHPQRPVKPVKCPKPPSITPDYGYGIKWPPNSQIPIDSPGSTYSFFCNSDFHLQPSDPFRVCQDNGTWSGVPLKCIVDTTARCSDPKPLLPEHSFPKNPMLEFPIFSILHMDCKKGWVGRGNLTVQCDHRKQWLIDFQCRPECPFIDFPEHSQFGPEHNYPNVAVDETVSMACEPGYHLLGVPGVTCNSSGHSEVQFGCCPDLQTYENMRSTYQRNPEYFYGPIIMLMALLNVSLVATLVHRKKLENKIISADMIKVKPAKGMDLGKKITPPPKAKAPVVKPKDVKLHVQMRTVRNPVAHEYSPYRKISKEDTF